MRIAFVLAFGLVACGGGTAAGNPVDDALPTVDANSDASSSEVASETLDTADATAEVVDSTPDVSADVSDVPSDALLSCSALALPASISVATVAGPPSLADFKGGAVTPGIYHLVSATDYAGPAGGHVGDVSTTSRALRVDATTTHYDVVRSDGAGAPSSESGDLHLNATVTWGQIMACPSVGTLQNTRFKSDGTTISLLVGAPSGAERIITMVLQP